MTTTALMNLVLPTPGPGGTAGPGWAAALNTALTLVDQHDHSSGKGTQINPAGINISQDFSINSHNLNTVASCRFDSQAAALATASDIRSVYSVAGDLYWNNTAGTPVQITSGSTIAVGSLGAIGGLAAPAACNYGTVTKVFSFLQDSNKTAKMACGDILLYENIVGANPVTIKSPTSCGAAYSVTLPAAIAGVDNSLVTMTAAGALGYVKTNDLTFATTGLVLISPGGGSALAWGQVQPIHIATDAVETAKIKNLNVTGAKIASGAVTQVKMGALGQQVSTSTSGFTVAGVTETDVTNASVTITTTGRPVVIMLISSATDASGVGSTNSGGFQTNSYFYIYRDAGVVAGFNLGIRYSTSGSNVVSSSNSPASIYFVDVVGAGTYTYKLTARGAAALDTARVSYCKLLAYEL